MPKLTEEQKAKRRENYKKNKISILEKMRLYRQQNPEKIKERKRIYYKKNTEKIKEKVKKYTIENKEIVSEGRREYYNKNKEIILAKIDRESRKRYNQAYFSKPNNRIKSIIRKAEQRAIEKNLCFDQDLYNKYSKNIPQLCKCCGEPFDYSMGNGKTRKSLTPSIDRRNNNEGYTISNTEFICFKCNTLKSDATLIDIENLNKYIKKEYISSDYLLWT